MRKKRYYGQPLRRNSSFSTTDALLVAGGVAVVGTIGYFIWKASQSSSPAQVSTVPATTSPAISVAATDINPPAPPQPLPQQPPQAGGVPLPVAPSA